MNFDDVPDANERLRSAIDNLYAKGLGMSPSRLTTLARIHHDELVARKVIEATPDFPNASTLTRYRTGEHRQMTLEFSRAYWTYIRDVHPHLLGLERSTDTSFVHALFWFFDVDWRKHDALIPRLQDSTFIVYHFTKMLAEQMPDAVVVGEMKVGKPDARLLPVSERQSYDGRLGKAASRDDNVGYCFPKSASICMLLKDQDNTPKFYVFHEHGRGEDKKVSWMNGRLAVISNGAPLFVSNVHAIKVPDDHSQALNIFPRADIPAAVMAELDRG